MEASLVPMPAFLLVGTVINLLWLKRGITDVRAADTTASRNVLALAVSSLIWVLFCFVQCFVLFVAGRGAYWWDPAGSATACAIMGTYSILASVSSMLLVTLIAYASWKDLVRGQALAPTAATRLIAASFATGLILALLPLIGAGDYAYSGEGFCYYDWDNAVHVVAMELITVPCLAVSTYFFLQLASASGTAPADAKKARLTPTQWRIMAASFLLAWFLWIPAAFIGLAAGPNTYPGSFPKGYMIIGGVAGHSQPIINAYLFGMLWRGAFVLGDRRQVKPKDLETTGLTLGAESP